MALERALEQTLTPYSIGPENPVEAWIISSTAGGTGEGIHRFVGAFLADFIRRRFAGTQVTLNFIRVGQLTYRTVNFRRTALNTFFGVAADAAFALKMTPKMKEDFEKFGNLVTRWFYVDLPDVGTGERSIPLRAQLVEMAAKAVMLDELQDDLQRLLVNNSGIPMVLTRTGYWGKDFEEQQKYYETLQQLQKKLKALVEPNYEDIVKGREPEFHAEKLEDWRKGAENPDLVLQQMEKGWEFPRYRESEDPKDLGKVRELVDEWKRAIAKLVERDWEELKPEWKVERVREKEGKRQVDKVPLRVPRRGEVNFGEEGWFQRINEAHEVQAWAWHLLGCDLKKGEFRRGGLTKDLLEQARGISAALHGVVKLWKSSQARARDAAPLLGKFVELLAKVDVLLRLEDEARGFLDGERSNARKVLEMVDSELKVVEKKVSGGRGEVVQAAELEDPLEQVTRKTWLQLLWDAARRDDREAFRKEVLRGATGLTEDGLREVLGLRPQAIIADAHQEMASRMGRMYDLDGNPYEAPWWAATPPTPTMRYEYRVLPWLSRELQAGLQSTAEIQKSRFRYVFTKMGRIGLYVLAFEGISLTSREGDATSMPAFLIRPFVPQLRDALAEWRDKPSPNQPSGQLSIVLAGVGGEPLYLPALREVGLSDEEIKKIGEFYQFYGELE